MNLRIIKSMLVCVVATGCVFLLSTEIFAQASAKIAGATPVNKTTGKSSTILIQQNQLNLLKANIERQLRVAQRCVKVSSLPVLLRDPQGNVNQVPKNDITFCNRKAKSLTRELAAIERQILNLTKDGQVTGIYIADAAAKAALAKRATFKDSLSAEQ